MAMVIAFVVPFVTITSTALLFYSIAYFSITNGGIGIMISVLTAMIAASISAILSGNALSLCK